MVMLSSLSMEVTGLVDRAVGVKQNHAKTPYKKTVQELRLRIFGLIETLKKFLQ